MLPAVLAAIVLPVTPALAGEDDDTGTATLRTSQGCVSGDRAKAAVSGRLIDSVAFFLDGRRIKTATRSDAGGRYSVSISCANLRVGAHRGKAVVTFAEGATPVLKTLRFQITRSAQVMPRFAG